MPGSMGSAGSRDREKLTAQPAASVTVAAANLPAPTLAFTATPLTPPVSFEIKPIRTVVNPSSRSVPTSSYCLWPGDTFNNIAQAAHIPLSELEAQNPQASRYAGSTIYLPEGSQPPDTWNLPTPVVENSKDLPFGVSGYYLGADNRHKRVALTFDIGFVPENKTLITWLRDQGIRATFFVLGISVSRHPELVTDILTNGHILGSHSWDHLNFQDLTVDEIYTQMEETEKAVQAAHASATTKPYFRAPYGAIDARVQTIAQELGYHVIGWTVDSKDWVDGATEEQIYTQVTEQVCPGAIILMHDANPANTAALPRIVDFLKANDYEIVSITDLLGFK